MSKVFEGGVGCDKGGRSEKSSESEGECRFLLVVVVEVSMFVCN